MTDDPKRPSDADRPEDLTVSYVNTSPQDLPPPQVTPGANAPANAVFAPGQILAGRFKVVRFVARGGMGEVYEAQDQELNERVAVKTARFESSQGAHEMERFRREIQFARRVTHPNVCRTFDVFRHVTTTSTGDSSPEILLVTMELLAGKTLHQRIRAGGRLTTSEGFTATSRAAMSCLPPRFPAGRRDPCNKQPTVRNPFER